MSNKIEEIALKLKARVRPARLPPQRRAESAQIRKIYPTLDIRMAAMDLP